MCFIVPYKLRQSQTAFCRPRKRASALLRDMAAGYKASVARRDNAVCLKEKTGGKAEVGVSPHRRVPENYPVGHAVLKLGEKPSRNK